MNAFTVSSDSTCDLYASYCREHDVKIAPLTFTVEKDGKIEERLDDFTDYSQYVGFYNELRAGAFARTSMLNYEAHLKHFTKLAEEGARDVLHVTISSGLSPTKDVAAKAAEEVRKRFSRFRVYILDPLTATVGQGALVMLAVKWRDEGKSAKETIDFLNSLRLHIQHFIVASDLRYLCKGGRISAASAAIGGILGIKPIVSFDNEGKLFVLDKVRGTRKAISYIKNKLEKEGPDERKYLFIVHTGNEPAAEELAGYVRTKFGFEPHVSIMGPVIGSHVGPDAFALGYLSKSERNKF